MTIKEFSVRTVQDAFRALEELTNNSVIFRGHQLSEWRLSSTLARQFPHTASRMARWDIDHILDQFVVGLASIGHNLPFANDNRRGRLEYARHYGVPSPLIDFSLSPYVALFFAINGVQPSKSSMDRASVIYCLNIHELAGIWARLVSRNIEGRSTDAFAENHNRFLWAPNEIFASGYKEDLIQYFDAPASWNIRMLRQMGVFLYDALQYENFDCRDLEEFLMQDEVPGPEAMAVLTKVYVPHRLAREIFERLDLMGLSAAHLFGNPEGVAADVMNGMHYGRRSGRAWDVTTWVHDD